MDKKTVERDGASWQGLSYLCDLYEFKEALDRNVLDFEQYCSAKSDRPQTLVYVLDSNVVRYFMNPIEEFQKANPFKRVLEAVRSSKHRKSSNAANAAFQLLRLSSIITAEYLFSKSLPAQNGLPIYIAPAQAREVEKSANYLISQVQRPDHDWQERKEIWELYQQHFQNAQKALVEYLPRKKDGHILSELLQDLFQFENPKRQLANFLRLQRKSALSPLHRAPFVTPAALDVRDSDVFSEWLKLLERPGVKNPVQDATTLAQITGLNDRAIEKNLPVRYVYVTDHADIHYAAAKFSEKRKGTGTQRFQHENIDSYVRHVFQFVPIINSNSIPNRIRHEDAAFRLQEVLSHVVGAEDNEVGHSFRLLRQATSSVSDHNNNIGFNDLRTQFQVDLAALSKEAERTYPKLFTDHWLKLIAQMCASGIPIFEQREREAEIIHRLLRKINFKKLSSDQRKTIENISIQLISTNIQSIRKDKRHPLVERGPYPVRINWAFGNDVPNFPSDYVKIAKGVKSLPSVRSVGESQFLLIASLVACFKLLWPTAIEYSAALLAVLREEFGLRVYFDSPVHQGVDWQSMRRMVGPADILGHNIGNKKLRKLIEVGHLNAIARRLHIANSSILILENRGDPSSEFSCRSGQEDIDNLKHHYKLAKQANFDNYGWSRGFCIYGQVRAIAELATLNLCWAGRIQELLIVTSSRSVKHRASRRLVELQTLVHEAWAQLTEARDLMKRDSYKSYKIRHKDSQSFCIPEVENLVQINSAIAIVFYCFFVEKIEKEHGLRSPEHPIKLSMLEGFRDMFLSQEDYLVRVKQHQGGNPSFGAVDETSMPLSLQSYGCLIDMIFASDRRERAILRDVLRGHLNSIAESSDTLTIRRIFARRIYEVIPASESDFENWRSNLLET